MIRGYLSPGLIEYLEERARIVHVRGATLMYDQGSDTWTRLVTTPVQPDVWIDPVVWHPEDFVTTMAAPIQPMYDLASTNTEHRPVMDALLKTREQREAERAAAKRERKAARRARTKDLVTLGKLFEQLVTWTSAFDLDPDRSNGHLRYWSHDGKYPLARFLSAEECAAVRRIPGRS